MKELPAVYKKRASISENGNSILKNKYGDIIYAKKFRTQKIEGLGKMLTYDIEKVINMNYFDLLSTTLKYWINLYTGFSNNKD